MKPKNIKRDKAWLGALVSGVLSLAGGIASNKIAANNAEKQIREQERIQNQANGMQQAANLTNTYNTNDYNNLYDRVSFAYGGRGRKSSRKKCEMGAGAKDTLDGIISGLFNAGNSVSSAAMQNNKTPINTNYVYNVVKKEVDRNDYMNDLKNNSYDRLSQYKMYKCGGRSKRR